MAEYLLVRALKRKQVERPPVWLMRQAGRYMQAYREIRSKVSFLELCKTPKLAAEVTLQPYRRFGTDALIIFSDILIPVEAMGMHLELSERGPLLEPAARTEADIARLRTIEPTEDTPHILEAIREVRRQIADEAPVIGFAGAPWTLASYMVEGGSSRHFIELKRMMYSQPQLLHQLLNKLAQTVKLYLMAQIDAGVSAVQLFDTWAGELSVDDYRCFALPYLQQIVSYLHSRSDCPVILYTNGCAGLLEQMLETGADCISIDWRISMAEAVRRIGGRASLQGNVDPCALLAPPDVLRAIVKKTIADYGNNPGLIVNLGHGVLPPTPEQAVEIFVETVKTFRYE
ncbi:MAG: uroporphyrinogen decarboxylase [Acidobacteriota bacterium]|nr:uroporphyrinogen decarboxylase [Blastocatellia bacterium]MDW8413279.1 uroporphyrinogen decarboxylase [Acidobacteriota bacterium]